MTHDENASVLKLKIPEPIMPITTTSLVVIARTQIEQLYHQRIMITIIIIILWHNEASIILHNKNKKTNMLCNTTINNIHFY